MATQPLKSRHIRPKQAAWAAAGVIAALILAAVITGPGAWAAVGARGAEVLRGLLGDQAVAGLETTVFTFQDNLHQLEFHAGSQPAAPWTTAAGGPANAWSPLTLTTPAESTPWASAADLATPNPGATPPASPGASGAPETPGWTLSPVPDAGSLRGAGRWLPYIHDGSGQVVAYRTFVQPDPQRPYTVVAMAAFDLKAVKLHFVLGSQEPKSTVAIDRPGTIPASDFTAGTVLAAFNGGFKAQHGHFGVIVDGVTVIPPRPGLGTIAISANGQVSIGAWGTDITAAPNALAYRQNGPLLIHNGQINPLTADNSPQDWGYTVGGRTASWRSGLGVSADGRTLYYVAGPSLTLPALATSLARAGAAQAVQLDINDYWVHFDTFQTVNGNVQPMPLVDSMQLQDDQRYIRGFIRDFFYVTADMPAATRPSAPNSGRLDRGGQ